MAAQFGKNLIDEKEELEKLLEQTKREQQCQIEVSYHNATITMNVFHKNVIFITFQKNINHVEKICLRVRLAVWFVRVKSCNRRVGGLNSAQDENALTVRTFFNQSVLYAGKYPLIRINTQTELMIRKIQINVDEY